MTAGRSVEFPFKRSSPSRCGVPLQGVELRCASLFTSTRGPPPPFFIAHKKAPSTEINLLHAMLSSQSSRWPRVKPFFFREKRVRRPFRDGAGRGSARSSFGQLDVAFLSARTRHTFVFANVCDLYWFHYSPRPRSRVRAPRHAPARLDRRWVMKYSPHPRILPNNALAACQTPQRSSK